MGDPYNLDLDGNWNKELMPHSGRHTNKYHDYMLDKVKSIDKIAQGNSDIFYKKFRETKKYVMDNPDILTSKWQW